MVSFVEQYTSLFANSRPNNKIEGLTFQELETILGPATRQGNYVGWNIQDKKTKMEKMVVWAYAPQNNYLGKELYQYKVKEWNVWTNSDTLHNEIFGV